MGTNRSQRGRREFDGVDSSGWDGQPIDYNPGPALLPPVIDSVNDIEQNVSSGFDAGVNLSGGLINPALCEFTVTHFSSDDGPTRPVFPGPSWTAYTQDPGDEGIDWDWQGSENGPVSQPTDAGPYIGAAPYNSVSDSVIEENPGGGGRWKRIQMTVANAAGSDVDFVYIKMEGF